ncbi:MAG: hypothetical protein AAF716_14610 [Cyanobacteria bacterium P01_D01_bin.1]
MNRRLSQRLTDAVLLLTVLFYFVLAVPAFSWAADFSSNQAIDQPAILTAPEPDAKIAVYLQPTAEKGKAGYGVNGDAVTVLEQVSDNQSLIWNHVRFDNPPYAEGWIQETFLDLKVVAATQGQSPLSQQSSASSNSSIPTPTESRYLGNRQSQASGQSQASQYSQSNQRSQSNQYSQSNQRNSSQSYSQRNQN